jgi:hypothetical protein
MADNTRHLVILVHRSSEHCGSPVGFLPEAALRIGSQPGFPSATLLIVLFRAITRLV